MKENGEGSLVGVMPSSWSEKKNKGMRRGNGRLGHLKKNGKEKKPKSKKRNEKRKKMEEMGGWVCGPRNEVECGKREGKKGEKKSMGSCVCVRVEKKE